MGRNNELIEVEPEVQTTNNKNQTVYRRNHTFVYHVKTEGCMINVCKKVFLKVHGVSADRIKRICHLLVQSKSPLDLRGKNRSGNAKPGTVCLKIH